MQATFRPGTRILTVLLALAALAMICTPSRAAASNHMWEILPDYQGGRTWNGYDLSNTTGADSVGTPSVISDPTYGQRVYSRSASGELLETVPDGLNGRNWNAYNLTTETGAPTLAFDPRGYNDGGRPRVYGVDKNGHLLEFIADGAAGRNWNVYDMSTEVGVGNLVGTPTVQRDKKGSLRVYVRNAGGTLYEVIADYANGHTWNAYDMTAASRAPSPLGGDPATLMGPTYPEIYSVDTRGHLISMVVDFANPSSAWSAYDLSEATGLSGLVGRPAVTLDADGMRRVYVRTAGGDLFEFVNDGRNSRAWNPYNLSVATGDGTPKLGYDPAVVVANGQLRVYGTSTGGHVIEFIADGAAGRNWNSYDTTWETGAAPPGGGVAAVASAPLVRVYQGPAEFPPAPPEDDDDGGDAGPDPNGDALIDPTSAACAPTPDGIDARCAPQVEEDPDADTDTGGVFAPSILSRPSLAASAALQVRSLIVANPYATIRSGPGSFAVGNAKNGWTFDRVAARASSRFGTVYGSFKGCGWVRSSAAPNPGGASMPSGSPHSGCARRGGDGKVYPLAGFARKANCHGQLKTEHYCDRVSGGLTLAAGTVECFNVGPILHTGGVTTPCNGGEGRTIPVAHGKGAGGGPGQDVGWRYVTADGKWVAIKDGYYSVNQPAYVFVRRSDLPSDLCPRIRVDYQKDANGNPNPSRPMRLCAPNGSLYPVPPNK
jgi:hypothetical protein